MQSNFASTPLNVNFKANNLPMQLKSILVSSLFILSLITISCAEKPEKKPNVIFVFADQWRAQDLGYTGNHQVKTPVIDKLSEESVVFTNAVSGCPVCCPYRASLLTGQFPLTHGVFYNDKPLNPNANSLAKVYKNAGYQTAYIGKWHLNGHEPGETTAVGRKKFIPKERRQGFDFWQVLECTHDYNNSYFYDNSPEMKKWQEYDAIAQTKSAVGYINEKSKSDTPFLLMLSWGPPHAPYLTAPKKYQDMYSPKDIEIRPNVPEELHKNAKRDIAGYYAHITALDDCMEELLTAIDQAGINENTIFVFTSDHGDMLYSQGNKKKQQPWDESLMVPFILRYPAALGKDQSLIETPINTPDIMPTLLSLSGIEIPKTVEGEDYSKIILGEEQVEDKAVLIQCPVPFHQWNYKHGGREYRGVKTKRFTYVRDLDGPWLLYDKSIDPYQMNNLIGADEYIYIQADLESQLQKLLDKNKDEFLSGDVYMKKWNYVWDGKDSLKIQ